MAEFVVTGPDGKEYEVTAPPGASEDQIIGKVQSYVSATAPELEEPVEPETDSTEDYMQAVADYNNANRTALGRGFRRSVDLTGEGVGSALEGVGSVLGLEGLEEYGADMALENEAQLQRAEKSATRRQDVTGLGTGASYFGETLAESSVPMGIGIGAGAAAGAIAGGGLFSIPGAIIGAGAAALSQLPLFYGWNRQRQKEAIEQGLKTEINEGAAFLTAIPQAVAEGIVDRILVGGFFAKPIMKQGGWLTRIGKGSVRGAAAEIPTEIGQQVLERAQANLSLDSDEAISEYIDAGVAAGMIGGTVGGAGNIRAAKPEPEPDPKLDPTDEILQITGPGTPAVVRVDSEGKAKTSEELSTERTEGMQVAGRARQEILRTGEVSSKTMQDLRKANIPLESVSKVLEETKELGTEAKFNLEPIVVEEEAAPEKPLLQLEKPEESKSTKPRTGTGTVVYLDPEGKAQTQRDTTQEIKDKKATVGASFDTPSPEIIAQYETALGKAVQIKDTRQRQTAISELKTRINNVDVFEAIYSKNKSDIPPFILKEIEGATDADTGRPITAGSGTRVPGSGQADTSAEGAPTLEETRVVRPDVGPGFVDDTKSDGAPALGEPIFKGETKTSLAELTRNQKANLDVVKRKLEAGKITKTEANQRAADIKSGKAAAKVEAQASRAKKVEDKAERTKDEAELVKIVAGEQAGLDAAASRDVDKKASVASIKNTIESFQGKAKPEIKRWLSVASDVSLSTDVVKKATADGKLNSSDLKKLEDITTKKIPKRINKVTNSLSQVQEQLQKSPFPVEQLEAAAFDLVLGTSTVRKGTNTDAQKHFKGTGKPSALRIEKWINENLSKGAQEWFAGLKIAYSSGDPTAGTKARMAQETFAESVKEQFKGLDAFKKLPLDAVANLDDPMHPTIARLLLAGNLKSALEGLAITSRSPRVRALAQVLADNVGTTKLKTVKGLDSAGIFDPKTNTISLNTTEGLNTHTLLHEMLHAVVSAKLSNKAHPTTAQLNTLFKSVKGLLPTAYGSTNLDEFVSEAMSNPEFQAALASINVRGEPISALRSLMNIIANFARKLVGVSPVSLVYIPNINESLKGLDVFSAIDTLVQGNNLFDALIAPAPEYRNADMLPLNSTAKGVKALMSGLGSIQNKINKSPKIKDATNKFLDIVIDVPDKTKTLLLQLKDALNLGDTAEKVGLRDLGYNLHIAMKAQRGAMHTVDRKIREIQEAFVEWNNKHPKLKESLDKLIYSRVYGSTIYQVDPLISRTAAEKRYGKNSEKMNIWDMQQRELNKLSPSERTLLLNQYTKLRDTYKKMYEELKTVLFKRIDDALANDPEAATKLKNTVYSKIFTANTLDVYFPLAREGNYKLTYSYKNVNQAPEEEVDPSYVIRMFTSKTERKKVQREIEADARFENVKSSDGDFKMSHFENAPSFSFVGRTLDTLKSKGVTIDVQEEIVKLFIDALPETSFAKSLQKRKGYEGHMDSAIDAFSTKAFDLGRQIVRLDHSARILKIMNDINAQKEPDPAAMKAKSFVGKRKEDITASFKAVKEELIKRGEFARNPPSEPLVKQTNQFAFIYTIGFNVSSAIVNLSQLPLFVMPYLGARYGEKNTFMGVGTASRLVTTARNNVLDFYDINDQGDYILKSNLNLSPNLKKEFERVLPVVKMGAEQGLLTTSFIKDALGLDESGRKRSFGDNVAAWSAFFFNHGERYNRQTTLLLAYNLELSRLEGKKGFGTRTAAEAKLTTSDRQVAAANSAVRQTEETNGGAVLETAPRITQRGLGRIAFMYKSYGLRMYTTMLRSALTMIDKDMSKSERKIAVKQIAYIHGSALFFAGVHGIPIYGAASVIYNLLVAGEDDDDFDTAVRKYIGEGWFKGALAMTGIDPSNRIRLTGLLLQENKFDRNSDLEGLIGFHLGGPALSSAKRVFRGATDLYKAESPASIRRGMESLLPAGVANMYKATPFVGRLDVEDGYRSRRGDVIYDDINPFEQAGQFLGFAPTGYMLEQERNNIIKGIDTAIGKKRSNLLKQYYIAKRMGDFYGVREIRKDMREFSRKHREAAITPETIDRSMKQHAKTSLEMYNGIRLNPLMRETLEDSRDDWDQGLQLFD